MLGNEKNVKKIDEVEPKKIIGSKKAILEISKGLIYARKWAKEMRERNIDPMVGVLLYGVPGTAKSTIAEQMAWKYKQENYRQNVEVYKKNRLEERKKNNGFEEYKRKLETVFTEYDVDEKYEEFVRNYNRETEEILRRIDIGYIEALDDVVIYRLEGKDFLSSRVGGSTNELVSFFNEMKNDVKRYKKKFIVIIDEIDLLTPARANNSRSLEKERTIAILNLIDGRTKPGDIFIIATTNLPTEIESAIIRSGRIIPILVDLPTKEDRYELGEEYLRDIGFFDFITPDEVVSRTKLHVGDDWRRMRRDYFFLTKEKEENGETIAHEDAIYIVESSMSKSTPASLRFIAKFEEDYNTFIGKDFDKVSRTSNRSAATSSQRRRGPTLEIKFD